MGPRGLRLYNYGTTRDAPPGATFLTNPRSTADFPQTVTDVQENHEILNVRDDGWRCAQPTPGFSFELWPARVVY